MVHDFTHATTKPSNRLKHGLRSRARWEKRAYEAADLASILERDAPSCPLVREAACDLADAIMHLQDVRRTMNSLMCDACDVHEGRNSPIDVDEALASCLTQLKMHEGDFVTLWDYERKAISRAKKAMIRMDYVVLEAKRRERQFIDANRALDNRLDLKDFL